MDIITLYYPGIHHIVLLQAWPPFIGRRYIKFGASVTLVSLHIKY